MNSRYTPASSDEDEIVSAVIEKVGLPEHVVHMLDSFWLTDGTRRCGCPLEQTVLIQLLANHAEAVMAEREFIVMPTLVVSQPELSTIVLHKWGDDQAAENTFDPRSPTSRALAVLKCVLEVEE